MIRPLGWAYSVWALYNDKYWNASPQRLSRYWYAPRGGPTRMWAEFNDRNTRHEKSISFDQILFYQQNKKMLFESMKTEAEKKVPVIKIGFY